MPSQLSWIIPKRVILIELSGETNDDEILEGDREICDMMDAGDPNAALIHQIMVFGEVSYTPKLKTLTKMQSPNHPRNGWMIVVGMSNPLLRMIGELASQIMRRRARQKPTIKAALEFLYEMDATLPDPNGVKASV
jgi:hypothetical protein